MRILFMGTPEFAVEQLRRLVEMGHEICGVFTQPDKPKNRGMKLAFSCKGICPDTGLGGLSAYQNARWDGPGHCGKAAAGADGGGSLRTHPAGRHFGGTAAGVHQRTLLYPAPIPGAAPINWAILDGCKETGVTIMHMAKELDAGDIICVKKTEILPDENAQELTHRLALLGADALEEAVTQLANGTAARTPQDHSAFTYAPMLSKETSPHGLEQAGPKAAQPGAGADPWPCASTGAWNGGLRCCRWDGAGGAWSDGAPGRVADGSYRGPVRAGGPDTALCPFDLWRGAEPDTAGLLYRPLVYAEAPPGWNRWWPACCVWVYIRYCSWTKVPDRAAVHETVELTKRRARPVPQA